MSTALRPRPATSTLPRLVATPAEIEADANTLRTVVRQARTVCGKISPVGKGEVTEAERAAQGMLYSPRFKGLEHLVTILYDMVDRGIPLEHLDAVGETITALVHRYAERRRGLKVDERSLAVVNSDVTAELSEGIIALSKAAAEPTRANLAAAALELAQAESFARQSRETIRRKCVS
jgi:hypothetical protein